MAMNMPNGKTKVIVDSSADFPPDYKNESVGIVPLIIKYQGKEWDEFQFSREQPDFFRKNPVAVIQTSQPAPKAFIDEYVLALKEGYDSILAVTLSAGVSGTYETANLAANELVENKIISRERISVIDSKTASTGLALLAMDATRYLGEHSFTEAVGYLKQKVKDTHLYAVLHNLKHAIASGRVLNIPKELSRFVPMDQSKLGSFIRMNFLLKFILETGKLDVMNLNLKDPENRKELRSISAMMDKIVGLIKADGVKVFNGALMHGDSTEATSKLEERIRQNFEIGSLYTTGICKALRGHSGPTLWGVSYLT